jgi:hypothetical protein
LSSGFFFFFPIFHQKEKKFDSSHKYLTRHKKMQHYYNTVYPAQEVWDFVQLFSPGASDWLLKNSTDSVPFRGQISSADELIRLTRKFTPTDGVHAVLSGCMQFDLDYDSNAPDRSSLCKCTATSRLVCNKCFQIVACSALIYEWLLKNLCGFRKTLCVYSGGRGVHIFACDRSCADGLQRCVKRQIFSLISETAHELLTTMLTRDANSFSACFNYIIADNASIREDLSQSNVTLDALSGSKPIKALQFAIPNWIISVYGHVLVPYVRNTVLPQWYESDNTAAGIERLWLFAETGCKADPSGIEHIVSANCVPCALTLLHKRLSGATIHTMSDNDLSTDDDDDDSPQDEDKLQQARIFKLMFRLDTFMLLLYIFWLRADAHLLHKSHPLRLPFSPHNRTGKISLPITESLMTTLNVSGGTPTVASLSHSTQTALRVYTSFICKK